jgi:integrase
MAKGLTDISVRNLKPAATRREVPDAGARGLYVVVQPSGVRTFAVRFRFGGKNRKLTLQAGIGLAAARKAAADALYEVQQGRDPCAAKRHLKQAQRLVAQDTFRSVAEEYQRREGSRLRSANWRRGVLARHVYPTLGERPIGDIRRSEIIRLLDRIGDGSGGPMADRVLSLIRRIMNWHATRSDDFRSPIVRGMSRADERPRTRILSDDELRAVWNAAAGTEPFSCFVQFLLLTAARRTEAAAMAWSELDGTDWVLPASRNKAQVDLVRPLSAAAQAVLARVPRLAGCPFVFSTNGRRAINGFDHFKRRFDARCGVTEWTLHDLRRTARSLMSRAGVPVDHAEKCLGHIVPGIRATYDRHAYGEEMRRAYEALASLIERIIINSPEGRVIQMQRG